MCEDVSSDFSSRSLDSFSTFMLRPKIHLRFLELRCNHQLSLLPHIWMADSNHTNNTSHPIVAPPTPPIGYAPPSAAPHFPALPPGWEMRYDPQGKPYYIDHTT